MNLPSFLHRSFTTTLKHLAAAGLLCSVSHAQTGTNDVASAPTITGNLPVTVSVDTNLATVTGETFPSGFAYSAVIDSTIWFKWTAPSSDTFRLTLTGQDYDSILAVFASTSGSLPLASTAAQNNDFGESTGTFIQAESTVFLNATSGSVYYIMVGGDKRTSPSGSADLIIDTASTPANDDIASATDLGVQFPVQSVAAENGAARAEPGEPAHGSNATARRSLWWTWKAETGGMVAAVAQGTNPDCTLTTGVYTGGPDLSSLVKVSTFNVGSTAFGAAFAHFYAITGTTYYIAIDVGSSTPDSSAFDRFAVAISQPLIEVVAYAGGTMPGQSTQVLSTLGAPVVSDTNGVAFLATLKAQATAGISSANDQVLLYRSAISPLSIVAREADSITPSLSEKVVSLANPNLIERQGIPKLHYEVVGKGAAVTSANSKYLLRYDSSSFSKTVAARLGQTMGAGLTVKTINPPVVIGGTGPVPYFSSTLAGTVATADSAIIQGTNFANGQNATLLREGQAISGLTQIGFGQISSAIRVAKSDTGLPTFTASLKSLAPLGSPATISASNDTALFVGDEPRAMEDEAAPMVPGAGLDSSIHFASFSTPTINRQAEVAFVATLRGGTGPRKVTTATDKGIWTTLGTATSTAALAAVAREGYSATDSFGRSIPAVFDSFIEPIIITDHHVIFQAKLRGTEVDASNDIGLWAWSATSGLRMVFREGAYDYSTNATVASMLSFAANSISTNSVFLVNPARLDDLFILGSLVSKGTTNATNNLCLWHVGLDNGGDVELSECILRKGDLINDPAWPRTRKVATISSMVKNGAGDGAGSQVSRDSNIAVQVTATDSVTKATTAANIFVRASPLIRVQ